MKSEEIQETEVIPLAKEKKAKKTVPKDDAKKPILQKTNTRCAAGVPFKTKKEALNHLMKEKKLYYIVDENKAYYQCKKSSEDDCELCHLHKQTFDEDKSKIKLFDKDIVMSDEKNANRLVLLPKDASHQYFDNMEKRGAKKKHKVIEIEDSSEEIFECFQDEEKKRMLTFCARQILNGAKITSFLTTPVQPVCVINNSKQNDVGINNNKSNRNISSAEDSSDDKTYDSEDELSDSEQDDSKTFEKMRIQQLVEQFREYFQNDEEQDLFEDEMEPIHTNDKKLLFLNKVNNNVFEPEEDDNITPMGKLIEVSECSLKYATIMYKEKYCTIVRAIKDDVYGVLFRCSLSNNLFDYKMRRMGTIKSKSGSKNVFNYKIDKSYLKANKILV